MENIVCAPVLIPTLCRSEHFIRCIESLKRNSWAKYTDVYIALDYPSQESHWEGYKKICKYLTGDFSEFANFHIIKREENYGAGKNMLELYDMIFEKYDRFIRTDDDVEFSPNFLTYMNQCLQKYQDDKDVVAVTGYSYPLQWKVREGCNAVKNNFICPMWGIGFWTTKYVQIRNLIKDKQYLRNIFDDVVRDGRLKRMTDARMLDYVNGCLQSKYYIGVDAMTDMMFGIYMALENKYAIMPTISKVRNWGFDGSGLYCQNVNTIQSKKISAYSYPYSIQPIDEETEFSLCTDNSDNCEENNIMLNDFDHRSYVMIIRAKLKLLLYRMLGRKRYHQFKNMVKTEK